MELLEAHRAPRGVYPSSDRGHPLVHDDLAHSECFGALEALVALGAHPTAFARVTPCLNRHRREGGSCLLYTSPSPRD
eukprot:667778-Alexandrium_andersonii.AAC.2